MRYPFVLFDVGETLVGPRESYGAVYARVLGESGFSVSAEDAERELRAGLAESMRPIPPGTDRFSHFAGGETEFWSRVAARTMDGLGCPRSNGHSPGDVLRRLRAEFASTDAWLVYPDVVPVLEALRRNGCRLGVVSNWDSRLPALLEALQLDTYFDVIGVSHLERIEKPAPEFFLRILQRMGGRAEQALHIGNLAEYDLEGARNAGIDARLVDRRKTLAPSLEPLPDLHALPRIVIGDIPN